MIYNTRPIYKYLAFMFLLSLFIYHENKKIIYTIFFISLIITLFVMILDFIFIKIIQIF